SRRLGKTAVKAHADHHRTAPRARNQNSRITNQPQRPVISGRTALGRRVRDLAEGFAEALGAWPKLSNTQAAAVRRAAEMIALAEQARHQALRDGVVDPDQLIRLENLAARSVKALNLDRRRREVDPPSRSDHLRPQRQARRFFRVIV